MIQNGIPLGQVDSTLSQINKQAQKTGPTQIVGVRDELNKFNSAAQPNIYSHSRSNLMNPSPLVSNLPDRLPELPN